MSSNVDIAAVPTLSTDGWVFDPLNKANYLMSYFFEADYNQTQFYLNNVSSLTYLLYLYGNDPTEFASQLESTLLEYLGRYLNNVVVEAKYDLATESSSNASVNLYVSFSGKTGKTYTLSNMLIVNGSKLVQVVNNYNTGTPSNTPIAPTA